MLYAFKENIEKTKDGFLTKVIRIDAEGNKEDHPYFKPRYYETKKRAKHCTDKFIKKELNKQRKRIVVE